MIYDLARLRQMAGDAHKRVVTLHSHKFPSWSGLGLRFRVKLGLVLVGKGASSLRETIMIFFAQGAVLNKKPQTKFMWVPFVCCGGWGL